MKKVLLTLFTLIALFTTYNLYSYSNFENSQNNIQNLRKSQPLTLHQIYTNWQKEHGFKFTGMELAYRFKIFEESYNYIQKRNAEEGYEMLGLNNYSALTKEEFREKYLISKKDFQESEALNKLANSQEEFEQKKVQDLPVSVNWVTKGAVPPAVDSKSCNSSYAIASAAALSGAYYLETGTLLSLSAQQLVSCDDNNGGCRGGSDYYSYLYVMQYGIQTEASYPYTARASSCVYDSENVAFKSTDALRIKSKSVQTINNQLSQQTLSAWINADCDDFRHYRGGDKTFTGNFCTNQDQETNYVVLLAGYNDQPEDDQKPYLLIQTSMGPKWGNAGYMNLYKKEKGVGALYVNTRVSFPAYKE